MNTEKAEGVQLNLWVPPCFEAWIKHEAKLNGRKIVGQVLFLVRQGLGLNPGDAAPWDGVVVAPREGPPRKRPPRLRKDVTPRKPRAAKAPREEAPRKEAPREPVETVEPVEPSPVVPLEQPAALVAEPVASVEMQEV